MRAAFDAHLLDGNALVARRRIAVIHPQKRADAHRSVRLGQSRHALRRHQVDLAGAELFVVAVTEIEIGERFEGGAEPLVLHPHGQRRAAVAVACQIDALGREQKQRHRAVDHFLRVPDALDERVLLVDQRGDQLGGVDLARGHLEEMDAAVFHDHVGQRFFVVDLADRRDRVGAVMRAHDQRLGIVVGDAADAQVPLHGDGFFLELGAERRVLDVVDRTVKALPAPRRQARAARAQMRMVVRAEKQVENALFPQRRREKSAHESVPPEHQKMIGARSRFQTQTRKNNPKHFTTLTLICQQQSCVFLDILILLKRAQTVSLNVIKPSKARRFGFGRFCKVNAVFLIDQTIFTSSSNVFFGT